MHVSVEVYNPYWQQQFQSIEAQLEQALKDVEYSSVEHVGSTSVPGLAAKPVIDVNIVVQQQDSSAATKALENAGYQNLGDRGIPDRQAFQAPSPHPAQSIYVCIQGSQGLKNHLMVRDICRRNEEVRNAYSQKRLELANREWANIVDYCMAKNDILAWVLSQGGMPQEEIDQIRTLNTTLQREDM